MWVECDFGYCCLCTLFYRVDEKSFEIKFCSPKHELGKNPRLRAFFYNGNEFKSIDVGNVCTTGNAYELEKTFSREDMLALGTEPERLSHFAILSDTAPEIKAYPAHDGKFINGHPSSIKRAEDALQSVKKGVGTADDVRNAVKHIEQKIKKYQKVTLPIPGDYTWHTINSENEFFCLSSVRHILQSENFAENAGEWYFGLTADERIYAVCAKSQSAQNPFSNAQDCTVCYTDKAEDEFFYLVGILLLDDGQYFCIPD